MPQEALTYSQLPPDLQQRALELAGDCRATLGEMIGAPRRQFQAFDVRQSSAGPTIAINGDKATLLVGATASPDGNISTSIPPPEECKTYSRRFERFPSEAQVEQFRQEFDHPNGPT